ncbi:MAG: hypothetical protein QQN63_12225, partial [Nitrosopumilus sp.]
KSDNEGLGKNLEKKKIENAKDIASQARIRCLSSVELKRLVPLLEPLPILPQTRLNPSVGDCEGMPTLKGLGLAFTALMFQQLWCSGSL